MPVNRTPAEPQLQLLRPEKFWRRAEDNNITSDKDQFGLFAPAKLIGVHLPLGMNGDDHTI